MALKTAVWVQYLEWPPDGIQGGRVGAAHWDPEFGSGRRYTKTTLPVVDLDI